MHGCIYHHTYTHMTLTRYEALDIKQSGQNTYTRNEIRRVEECSCDVCIRACKMVLMIRNNIRAMDCVMWCLVHNSMQTYIAYGVFRLKFLFI